jgi:hemoglobin-like flavoprotein
MALDVQLLRDSFQLVLEKNPALTARFYEILFARHPSARPLFSPGSLKKQQDMLAQALAAVMDHLEDATWLTSTLGALGAKHVGYGVTAEMYDWVGDSLLRTLEEAAGTAWTPAHAQNWGEAYGVIVSLMRAGEARAAE